MGEVFEIFLHYIKFYSSSLVASFLSVCIIEYIFKNIIETIVKRKSKNSKKRIFFLKDYIYVLFPIIFAVILTRLAPIHRNIILKTADITKYYESYIIDFGIYLAEISLIFSTFFKIIIRTVKNKIKGE